MAQGASLFAKVEHLGNLTEQYSVGQATRLFRTSTFLSKVPSFYGNIVFSMVV